MNKKTIEKAARDYIQPKASIIPLAESIAAKEGFITGAEWRINSVWHDASEEPENLRYILVDNEYRIQAVWKQDIGDDWLNDVNHFGVTRWAYVDDLLPERKEETK